MYLSYRSFLKEGGKNVFGNYRESTYKPNCLYGYVIIVLLAFSILFVIPFHFTRLPQTRKEVNNIRALLGESHAEIYTGTEALEEVLRQRQSPSILHLATHGFFLSDLKLSDLGTEGFDRGFQQISMLQRPTGKKIKIENPLLRSGIALAGANNALKYSEVNRSDGIVTAEKILGLRLRGTNMVVLSACETGLGEVKTGEGVFGLRRAFTRPVPGAWS